LRGNGALRENATEWIVEKGGQQTCSVVVLQILLYFKMCRCKDFENLSILDELCFFCVTESRYLKHFVPITMDPAYWHPLKSMHLIPQT